MDEGSPWTSHQRHSCNWPGSTRRSCRRHQSLGNANQHHSGSASPPRGGCDSKENSRRGKGRATWGPSQVAEGMPSGASFWGRAGQLFVRSRGFRSGSGVHPRGAKPPWPHSPARGRSGGVRAAHGGATRTSLTRRLRKRLIATQGDTSRPHEERKAPTCHDLDAGRSRRESFPFRRFHCYALSRAGESRATRERASGGRAGSGGN